MKHDDLSALDADIKPDELDEALDRLALTAEGRSALNRVRYCQRCGAYCSGREVKKMCRAKTCTTWCCPGCGADRGTVTSLECLACHALQWWERPAVWVADCFWDVWFRVGRWGRK